PPSTSAAPTPSTPAWTAPPWAAGSSRRSTTARPAPGQRSNVERARQDLNPQNLLVRSQTLYPIELRAHLLIRFEPVPTELSRRSPTVTVCAPNSAPRDFGLNCTPCSAFIEHGGDIPPFLRSIAMIEIQNDRVSLAAVDTWMV